MSKDHRLHIGLLPDTFRRWDDDWVKRYPGRHLREVFERLLDASEGKLRGVRHAIRSPLGVHRSCEANDTAAHRELSLVAESLERRGDVQAARAIREQVAGLAESLGMRIRATNGIDEFLADVVHAQPPPLARQDA